MSSKSAALIIASALLSSAIIYHAWYPIHHGPEATRANWVQKCFEIEGKDKWWSVPIVGKDGLVSLSAIPDEQDKETNDDRPEWKSGVPIENRYEDLLDPSPDNPRVQEAKYELEQSCMVKYAILLRGGR